MRIVIDASAMAEMLMASTVGARVAQRVFAVRRRHAPHLLDIEVVSALRRFVLGKQLPVAAAQSAIDDLAAFPMRRHGHGPLLARVFELRHNLSAYDALYLALAEGLDATLVTCDEALANVPGARAAVELIA
jgi:predicted nucleic acid-binding protein